MGTDHSNLEHDIISWQKSQRRGKALGGFFIVLFGLLYLLAELGVQIPRWVFSWEMILITIGFVVTVKHKFKKLFGYALMAVGLVFLLRDFYPFYINVRLLLPVIIIVWGLSMIFKSKKAGVDPHKFRKKFGKDANIDGLFDIGQDDFIDSVSFFSGVKKNVLSKNFRGADIVTIFGGSDINLTQADFQQQAIIDVTTIFGGMTLVIPADWQVKSEVISIFGGLEDKRPANTGQEASNKVLILKGTCAFGGIEINSFMS